MSAQRQRQGKPQHVARSALRDRRKPRCTAAARVNGGGSHRSPQTRWNPGRHRHGAWQRSSSWSHLANGRLVAHGHLHARDVEAVLTAHMKLREPRCHHDGLCIPHRVRPSLPRAQTPLARATALRCFLSIVVRSAPTAHDVAFGLGRRAVAQELEHTVQFCGARSVRRRRCTFRRCASGTVRHAPPTCAAVPPRRTAARACGHGQKGWRCATVRGCAARRLGSRSGKPVRRTRSRAACCVACCMVWIECCKVYIGCCKPQCPQ